MPSRLERFRCDRYVLVRYKLTLFPPTRVEKVKAMRPSCRKARSRARSTQNLSPYKRCTEIPFIKDPSLLSTLGEIVVCVDPISLYLSFVTILHADTTSGRRLNEHLLGMTRDCASFFFHGACPHFLSTFVRPGTRCITTVVEDESLTLQIECHIHQSWLVELINDLQNL